jgi:hypothetical protein
MLDIHKLFKGLYTGEVFFDLLCKTGYRVLLAISVFTSFVFWVFMAVYLAPEFTELGIFMVKVIQIFFLMTVIGFIFKVFVNQIYDFLYYKELHKVGYISDSTKCPQKRASKQKKNQKL